jgi:CheY-like chemotaxis protein
MEQRCPLCGSPAIPAGHEDARAYFQCENCKRVWATALTAHDWADDDRGEHARVLVADDSDQLVEIISLWLEDAGYEVVRATTGRQALDAASVHPPDVAIVDLIMPPPDGFTLIDALRRLPSSPEIIVMTGIADPQRLRRADDLGAVAVLRKPVSEDVILAAVAVAFTRRHRNVTSNGR